MNGSKKTFQIKRIVCPTDFSFESFVSINYAAQIAGFFGATLYLCYYKSSAWDKTELPEAEDIEKLSLQIESLINEKRFKKLINWHLVIIEGSADPARCIAAFADEMDCDLIVLRPRPKTLRNTFCGSLPQKLIQISPCPVLLLPLCLHSTKSPNSEFKVERILLNYSFAPNAEELFDYAASLTKALEAELHILSILPPPENMGIELSQTSAQRNMGERLVLEKIASQALHHEYCPVIASVRTGNAQSETTAYIARKKIDMVCMLAPKDNFYFEYLFPVWLKQLQHNLNVPVLIWNGLSAGKTISRPVKNKQAAILQSAVIS